jgi:Na+-transporting NADH:ubiquinone oxidoreductase subunit NqrC
MNKKHTLSQLGALVVFVLLAVGIVSVLLSGAQAYRRLTQRDQQVYDSRTGIQYIATRIRQAPGPEAVVVMAFGQGDCLSVCQNIGGQDYVTRIYCHDGWLRELFTAAQGDFDPADGEKILPAQDLSLSLADGLLTAVLTDTRENTQTISLQLRGSREVWP